MLIILNKVETLQINAYDSLHSLTNPQILTLTYASTAGPTICVRVRLRVRVRVRAGVRAGAGIRVRISIRVES